MSKTIDDRIVRMTFDTGKFQNGVKGVLDGLKSIDKSLAKDRKFKGLDSIGKSISDVTSKGMGGLGTSIDNVAGRFSALEVMGVTALANITNSAINMGMRVAKSFTLDPIMDGFQEYELKMNSIQTILTNTEQHGTKLRDVNKALGELNEYSDKTIYNFAQMTDNIGKATSAGLELGDAVTFVKGMANTAAGFGVDATAMAGATQQMTQALSQGYVQLQDWVSMEQRGMAGKKLQQAFIDTAKSIGIATPALKDFRYSLKDGWLTTDVFIKTMEKMANDPSLVAAATNVTSLTKLIGVLKEAVGTGWATTFEQILGGKDASTALFTGINDAITNDLINPMADARTAAVDMWLEMEGRENTIKAFANIWESIGNVLGPIGEAFNAVFPKSFGEMLGHISKGFLKLTESLMVSKEFSGFVKDAFSGIFKVIQFGIEVLGFLLAPLGQVFDILAKVGAVVGSAIVAFLKMTYVVGDYIRELTFFKEAQEAFEGALKVISDIAGKFGDKFNDAVKGAKDFFDGIDKAINGLFKSKDKVDETGKSADKASKSFESVKTVGEFVANTFDNVKQAGEDVSKIFNDAKDGAENAAEGLMTFLINLKDYIIESSPIAKASEVIAESWEYLCGTGDRVREMINSIDFSPLANTFNKIKETFQPITDIVTGVFNTLVDAFKSLFDELDLTGGQLIALLGGFAGGFGVFKIISKISDLISNILNPVGNLSDAAVGVLDGVRDCLAAYQNDIQANTLHKIAMGVLMLSGALLILSQLEMSQVQAGLLGVGGLLVGVITSLAVLVKVTSGSSVMGILAMAPAFVALGGAILAMSGAMLLLSSIDMKELSSGLLGMAGMLSMLTLTLAAVGTMTGSIVKAAFAMSILAGSLNIMYVALSLFSRMDTSTMNNSLMSVGMALGILVLTVRGLNKVTANIPSVATGIFILSGALILLAKATSKFGKMDTDVITQGLLSVTIILGALAIFNSFSAKSKMSFNMGAGLMGLAKALDMLYTPVKKFGELNVGELVKGISSLGLIMAGLTIMTNMINPKSGWQLISLSVGLLVFSKAIEAFSKMAVSFKDINLNELSSGLLKIGLAIAALSLAVTLIPEAQLGMLALGIGALSIALPMLTKAIEKAGNIPFDTMLKGFFALAGGLLAVEMALRLTPSWGLLKLSVGMSALALGFTAMLLPIQKLGALDFKTLATGLGAILSVIGLMALMNIGGMATMGLMPLSIGIGALSIALSMLAMPITLLGNLPLEVIGTGLLGLVGVLTVLGVAGLLMTPVVPVLFGLGSAITLLGTGMLAASGGLTLFSAGFAIFATTAALFGDELLTFFVSFAERLPKLVEGVALSFIKLVEIIGQNASVIGEATYQVLEAIVNAIISIIPLVAGGIVNLIATILNTLASSWSTISEAGFNLIMALLEGISKYVEPVVSKMVEILVTMANALSENLEILVNAGMELTINLIDGIAEGISTNSDAFSEAINNLIFSVLDAMLGFGKDFFKRGFDFVGEMIKGIFDNEDELEDTSTEVAESGVDGATSTQKDWVSAGSDFSAGVANGIASGRSGVVRTATSVARDAADAIKKELDINSPSRVTTEFGAFTSEGLALGISKFGYLVTRAGTKVAKAAVNSIEKPINNIALLDGVDFNPTVRPVMDLSNIKSGSRTIGDMLNGAAGTIGSFGSLQNGLVTSIGNIQNRNDNSDIVKAISKLRNDISNIQGTTNIIEGITYDDGSSISNTIGDLVRMARIERRR